MVYRLTFCLAFLFHSVILCAQPKDYYIATKLLVGKNPTLIEIEELNNQLFVYAHFTRFSQEQELYLFDDQLVESEVLWSNKSLGGSYVHRLSYNLHKVNNQLIICGGSLRETTGGGSTAFINFHNSSGMNQLSVKNDNDWISRLSSFSSILGDKLHSYGVTRDSSESKSSILLANTDFVTGQVEYLKVNMPEPLEEFYGCTPGFESGTYLCSGAFTHSSGQKRLQHFLLDELGHIHFNHIFRQPSYYLASATSLIDSSYIVYSNNYEDRKYERVVSKLDKNGELLWEVNLNTTIFDGIGMFLSNILLLENGDFLIGGTENCFQQQKTCGSLTKISSNGKIIWHRLLDNGINWAEQSISSVRLREDGKGYLLGGVAANSNIITTNRIWVLKTDELGCHYPNCDQVTNASNITKEEIFNIFPNPANDFLNIELNSNEIGQYTYQLLDLNGKTILNGFANGNEIVKLNSVAKGVYLLRIQSAVHQMNKKILRY